MRNILKQAKESGAAPAARFQALPDSADEEKRLAAYVETYARRVEAHRQKKEYQEALSVLSTAREPVDAFFDKVMVMAEDADLRRNRLALLSDLRLSMNRVADISKLAA
jgi:glycyl-tRNA synthetase beta chain